MVKAFNLVGDLAGSAGVAVCAVAGVARLSGAYTISGYELNTLFLGGIALMVMGCFAKLQASGRAG